MYCCLTRFFRIVDTCLNCEDIVRQKKLCGGAPQMAIFCDFFAPCVFNEPHAARFRRQKVPILDNGQPFAPKLLFLVGDPDPI